MVTEPRPARARLGDRLFALLGVRLVVWLIAAQAFLPGVLLDPAYKVAHYHDEHNVILHEEAGYIAMAKYHQLPAWEPYFCGGIVGLSNAPSNVLAPDFILRLIYGTLVGRKLAVLLFVVLGMEGTFRYARRNGASAIGAGMAAVAFSTSGHFVSLLGWGWIFMFHYNLVPWCALSFEEGIRKRWWIVAGGFFMAWLVLGGGTYVAPYTGVVLFLLLLNETYRAVTKREGSEDVRWWRPLLTLALMGVVAVGLSAIRLLPLADLLASHSRPVEQKDQTSPMSILAMLAVGREHGWAQGAGDFYIGSFVFLIAVLGLVLADRRAAKMWLIALVFAAFAAGEFIEDAPYLLMRKIPVLSQLRFPVRMLTITGLFIALASSRALTRIEDALPRAVDWAFARVRRLRERFPEGTPRGVAIVAAIVATGVSGWIALHAARDVIDHTMIQRGQIYVMDPPLEYDDQFRQARGNRWDAHVWPFASRGSLHCFEEHQLFESPYLRGDLKQEEYGAPGTDTTVERISWSPHRIVVRVKSSGPGRFLVNMNHARAWSSDVGDLHSDGGLISVSVPPGEHVVTLTYRDWKVTVGSCITAATIALIAFFGVRRLRRRGQALARFWRMLPGDDTKKGGGGKTDGATEPA
jgi:hypothetical protein